MNLTSRLHAEMHFPIPGFSGESILRKQDQQSHESTKKIGEKLQRGKVAEATGLEPATSTVTGWHSNQLSYASAFLRIINQTGGSDGTRTRNIHRDRVAL